MQISWKCFTFLEVFYLRILSIICFEVSMKMQTLRCSVKSCTGWFSKLTECTILCSGQILSLSKTGAQCENVSSFASASIQLKFFRPTKNHLNRFMFFNNYKPNNNFEIEQIFQACRNFWIYGNKALRDEVAFYLNEWDGHFKSTGFLR